MAQMVATRLHSFSMLKYVCDEIYSDTIRDASFFLQQFWKFLWQYYYYLQGIRVLTVPVCLQARLRYHLIWIPIVGVL